MQLVSENVPQKTLDRSRDNCFLRRKLDFVRYPAHQRYELFDALSRAIARFDDVPHRLVRGKYFFGPFGAFKLDTSEKSEDTLGARGTRASEAPKKNSLKTPNLVESITARSIGTPVPLAKDEPQENYSIRSDRHSVSVESSSPPLQSSHTSSRTNIHESSIFSKTDNAFVHYKLLDYAKLTILAIKGPCYKFTEQGMYHILYPKFFVNVESDDWAPSMDFTEFFKMDGPAVSIKPLLVEALLAVSARNVTFIRVAHPNCCWDSLVVPKLKEIMFELVCEEFPKNGSLDSFLFDREAELVPLSVLMKNLKFCILCLVLSIGRFERSRAYPPVKNPVDSYFINDDLRGSIELRKIATNYLNYHLDEYDCRPRESSTESYNNYFLLALILQIHLDNSFGVYENFDLIYAVGEYLANLSPEKETETHKLPYERYLRQVFKFFYVFYASTQSVNTFNYSVSETDKRQNYRGLDGSHDLLENVNDDEIEEDDNDSDAKELNDTKQSQGLNCVLSSVNENELLFFTVHFNKKDSSADFVKESHAPINESRRVERPRISRNSAVISPSSWIGPVIPKVDVSDPYVSLGIPESLFNLFREVIKLANDRRIFKLNNVLPQNYSKSCAEVKDRILTWNVENYWKLYDHEYSPITNSSFKKFLSKFHEGLSYNVECFYYALLTFFNRLIPEVPLQKCQENVQKSLAAMQKLSQVNAVIARSGDVSFSCSFWPLLVCGSEIDLRTNIPLRVQCEEMWEDPFFSKYNYWRSKQILFEIWNRQEEDGEYNGFMDMIREWDFVLNL